jgi:hypothetical protein
VAESTPSIAAKAARRWSLAKSAAIAVGFWALAAGLVVPPVLFAWRPALWLSMVVVWGLCAMVGATEPSSGCGDVIFLLAPACYGLYGLAVCLAAAGALRATISLAGAARS